MSDFLTTYALYMFLKAQHSPQPTSNPSIGLPNVLAYSIIKDDILSKRLI